MMKSKKRIAKVLSLMLVFGMICSSQAFVYAINMDVVESIISSHSDDFGVEVSKNDDGGFSVSTSGGTFTASSNGNGGYSFSYSSDDSDDSSPSASSGSRSSPAMTAAQHAKTAAACSVAWFAAGTQSGRDVLHTVAEYHRNASANILGGKAHYDPATGSSYITDSRGNVVARTNGSDDFYYTTDSGGRVNVSADYSDINISSTHTGVQAVNITFTDETTGASSQDSFIIRTDPNDDTSYGMFAFGSDALSSAEDLLKERGYDINAYNLMDAIDELYLGIGTTRDTVDGSNHPMLVDGVAMTGAEGLGTFADFLASAIGDSLEGYSDIYSQIREIEEDPELQEIKNEYMRTQGQKDKYPSKEEWQNELDKLHQQYEDERAKHGYQAMEGGAYIAWIPVVGPGGTGFKLDIPVDEDNPDPPPPPPPGEEDPDPEPPTIKVTFYPVIVTCGEGGTVTPGTGSFAEFSDARFVIKPNSGYAIDSVVVDDVSVGSPSTYTFLSISASHTLSVTFKKMSVKIKYANISSNTGSKDNTIKSGYGVESSVSVTSEGEGTVSVVAKYDWGMGNKGTVSLEQSGGKWVFPVNPESVTNARKIYIPVETKDGTYKITFTATMVDEEGHTVESTTTAEIVVKGSMYEDDFTGDRR